jgi:hypothetical protein
MTRDKLGTARPAITGSPPLPKPTEIAAKTAKNQNKNSPCTFKPHFQIKNFLAL